MTDAQAQALWSGIRSIAIAVGALLAAYGKVNQDQLNLWGGIATAVIPAAIGMFQKFTAEGKTKDREATAAVAGAVAANQGVAVTPTTAHAVIDNFKGNA